MTPYIITTTTYPPGSPMPSGQSRRAVATLEEAQRAARHEVSESLLRQPEGVFEYDGCGAWESAEANASVLPESGGTIGPLPDGTVIEVKPATWREIAPRRESPGILADEQAAWQRQVIDAYNAREAVHG